MASKKHQKRIRAQKIAAGAWRCAVCNIQCSSDVVLQQHLASKKHAKKVLMQKGLNPTPAQKDSETSDSAAFDLVEDRTPQPVQAQKKDLPDGFDQSVLKPFAPAPAVPNGAVKKPNLALLPFACEICNVRCTSQVVLESHLKSKRHAKTLKRMGGASLAAQDVMEDKNLRFRCHLCNVGCNSQAMLDNHLNSKKHQRKASRLGVNHPYKTEPTKLKPKSFGFPGPAANPPPMEGAFGFPPPAQSQAGFGFPPPTAPTDTPAGFGFPEPCPVATTPSEKFGFPGESTKFGFPGDRPTSPAAANKSQEQSPIALAFPKKSDLAQPEQGKKRELENGESDQPEAKKLKTGNSEDDSLNPEKSVE